MSDGSSRSPSSSVSVADDTGLVAVLAHSMLGTASAVHGALALALSEKPDSSGRDSLLGLALNRLEFLTEQLRELAAGVPAHLASAVDPSRWHGESVVEDGTPVELYSAFDRTWSAGFEIASAAEVGYRVRRLSDGSLLPGYTSRADLRMLEPREAR